MSCFPATMNCQRELLIRESPSIYNEADTRLDRDMPPRRVERPKLSRFVVECDIRIVHGLATNIWLLQLPHIAMPKIMT